LITILTVLAASLLLQIVKAYADQTAARGAAIVTVDALNMVLMCVLAFLLMRQVMPIAAGLASAVALNTFGSMSRLVNWSTHRGATLMRDARAFAAARLLTTSQAGARRITTALAAWRRS
jgi:type IV secretion system protein VirB6